MSGTVFAQQKSAKDAIAGAWKLLSVTNEMDDGKTGEPFGPSPKGAITFSNDGHFSLLQSRAEIPKIVADNQGHTGRGSEPRRIKHRVLRHIFN